MTDSEIESLLATPDASWPATGQIAGVPLRTTCVRPLEAGGESQGMIGAATPSGFTARQLQAFNLLVHQVASALAIARLKERRQEMVDTLVNLRADLDRSERQRLINEERARSADRVEHAHEAAVDALLAVSRHARTHHGLTDFYRRLTRSIAELVGAEKVLFWKLDDDNVLTALKGAHAIDDEFLARLYPAPCAADRDDLASRVVFHDLMFRATSGTGDGEFQYVLDVLGV